MRRPRLPRQRLRGVDLLDEAVAGIVQQPGRTSLSVAGIAIAVATFVTVLGLTTTANGQISSHFTALAATEVTVSDTSIDPTDGPGFTSGSEPRVRALAGVLHAGVFWQAVVGSNAVSATGTGRDGETIPVVAASPELLAAVHATTSQGMLFNEFHDRRHERVAVLGSAVASRLGITRVDTQPAIFVRGVPLTVVGIVGATDRKSDLLLSVIVPETTASNLWGAPAVGDGAKMLIETRLGAAPVVASQAALAARPDTPDRLAVSAPPDPHDLRDAVATELNTLFVALAFVALVIGAVGIANTMLVAVLERIHEIGLRRAVGAHRRHIVVQFVAESSFAGLIGGLLGTSVGIVVIVVVATVRHWTPVIEPWSVFPAPLVGGVTGLLAGLYPAYRAARIEPADALRR